MSLDTQIDTLKAAVLSYLSPDDWAVITKAYQMAEKAHDGQKRVSGEFYIKHPIAVAIILASMKQDLSTICAGLLHDVVEDTAITDDELRTEFGDTVADLVNGVTKLGSMRFGNHEEAQTENFRKLFLAMAKDLRVVMIKLADRLHNMRTLHHLRPDKQKRIAKETMDIFAPLAHRLGLGNMKWELEDLAFMAMQPEAFAEIKTLVATKRSERESYIQCFMDKVSRAFEEANIEATVFGRPKHFYSIYKKLNDFGIEFEELYDLLGIRVLTNTEPECYHVLGVVHTLFRPVAGRIKDYIAMPKLNGYQSLHTTVIGPEGRPIEIQIRTKHMNEVAEYGVAAHWLYKEKQPSSDDFAWIQDMADMANAGSEDYLSQLKLDLFEDEVFVFTPDGSIKALPVGSTPIDFAYKVHTEVGHRCVGAKVNGVIVPLSHVLQSGDQVEILTKKGSHPKLAWLQITVTRQAKANIKSWFKKQEFEEQREKGFDVLKHALSEHGYVEEDILKERVFSDFFDKHTLKGFDELAVQLSYGEISIRNIMRYLSEKLHEDKRPSVDEIVESPDLMALEAKGSGIAVMGDPSIEVRMAKCCRPLPGDEIVGFVTIGYGITVHRAGCHNVVKIDEKDRARLVDVAWLSETVAQGYPIELMVETVDSDGKLNEIVSTLLELDVQLVSVKSFVSKQDGLSILMQVRLKSLGQFEKVRAKLLGVPDIFSVYRPRH